jgi:hypothetical protein
MFHELLAGLLPVLAQMHPAREPQGSGGKVGIGWRLDASGLGRHPEETLTMGESIGNSVALDLRKLQEVG